MVAPREVARNVDGYLADLDTRGKARVQLALIALGVWPLLTARPPLPLLAPRRASGSWRSASSRRSPSGACSSRCARSCRR